MVQVGGCCHVEIPRSHEMCRAIMGGPIVSQLNNMCPEEGVLLD